MTDTAAREIRVVRPEDGTCWFCSKTGYRPDGVACDCTARPFDTTGPAFEPPQYGRTVAPRTHEHVASCGALDDAITDALLWSQKVLSTVVGLSVWPKFLRTGGLQEPAAERAMLAAGALRQSADELNAIADRLLESSHAVLSGETARREETNRQSSK